ncbi:MAG: hypothetical protein EBV03_10040 [Proteobacteria bacterium]|nr:hypothetical protein [Pseudomonadota bacterium]
MLKFAPKLAVLIVLTALPSAAAEPGRRGDLFDNQGYVMGNRPWVPSDGLRGQDLFQADQFVFSPQADVFNRRPNFAFGSEDMFNLRPMAPYPYQPMFLPPR